MNLPSRLFIPKSELVKLLGIEGKTPGAIDQTLYQISNQFGIKRAKGGLWPVGPWLKAAGLKIGPDGSVMPLDVK